MSTQVGALHLLKGAVRSVASACPRRTWSLGNTSGPSRKGAGGETVTLEQVQAHGQDHLRKQDAGVRSLTFSADQSTALGCLMVTPMTAAHGSAEREAATAQIEELSKRKLRRVSEDRHKLRMSALYVDAISTSEWNRPSNKVSQQEAYDFIRDAVNDYATPHHQQYSDLQLIAQDNPEWLRVLQEWPDRPKLPSSEWPPFPELPQTDAAP